MTRRVIEPISEWAVLVPRMLTEWLDRFRRQAAIIETITASIAVPALGAGATVVANVTVTGIETGDKICGFTYQYQAALYAAPGWITFDVWVYGADTLRITWHNPTGGALGGLNATYEFNVLKYKRAG